MYSKNIRESNLKNYKQRKLLLASAITLGILSPFNVIPRPLINPNFNEIYKSSNISFITKAVEKTGSSVVTIDTQRYIKRRKSPRNSPLFLDPHTFVK